MAAAAWRRFNDIIPVFVSLIFLAQMTVVNIPTTITLSVILRLRLTVISNKDLPSKILVLFLLTFARQRP
jgi:hypothetical protein